MPYRITAPAETDLIGIARYTRSQWGQERVAAYVNGLFEAFGRLAESPEIGQLRDDLRPGLRIALHQQHYFICYRVQVGEVQILRVIHTRRDVARQIAALRDPE